jgi:hypothetical protein
MRLFGKDLNEKVNMTRGHLLGLVGMLIQASGMLLGRDPSFKFAATPLVVIGLIFIVISLVQHFSGKPTGDTKTPDGN